MTLKKLLLPLCLLSFSFATSAERFSPLSLERQQSFTNIENNLDELEKLLEDRDYDVKSVRLLAGDLSEDINYLTSTAFEQPTFEKSRARERIWSNFEDFKSRLEVLQKSIDGINNNVSGDDMGFVLNEIDAAYSTCNACHRRYRTFW